MFNELVEAEQHPSRHPEASFDPSYMIDQSHNVTDPIESMLSSAEAITASFAKALLVDRAALHAAQDANDTMMAFQALRQVLAGFVLFIWLQRNHMEAFLAFDQRFQPGHQRILAE